MKALFLSTVFLLSTFLSFAQNSDSWAQVKKEGAGTVTVYYLPENGFSEIENGEPKGVSLEVLANFFRFVEKAKDVDLTVNYVAEPNFGKLMSTVKDANSGTFGSANITITEARRNQYEFSPPYLTNVAVLVTNTSVRELKQLDQASTILKGFTGLIYENTTHEMRVKGVISRFIPGAETKIINSNEGVMEHIDANPNSFGYLDLFVFWLGTQNGLNIKRQPAGDIADEDFGFAMPKDSDWAPLMDEFFTLGRGYRSTPQYRKILVDNLGSEFTKLLEETTRKGGLK